LKVLPICLLCMMSVLARVSSAQSGTTSVPEVNPGRPTVSTPATLTPVGYLQFETGVLFAQDSTEFSNRIGEAKEGLHRIQSAPSVVRRAEHSECP
jgi:hypothetical protein